MLVSTTAATPWWPTTLVEWLGVLGFVFSIALPLIQLVIRPYLARPRLAFEFRKLPGHIRNVGYSGDLELILHHERGDSFRLERVELHFRNVRHLTETEILQAKEAGCRIVSMPSYYLLGRWGTETRPLVASGDSVELSTRLDWAHPWELIDTSGECAMLVVRCQGKAMQTTDVSALFRPVIAAMIRWRVTNTNLLREIQLPDAVDIDPLQSTRLV